MVHGLFFFLFSTGNSPDALDGQSGPASVVCGVKKKTSTVDLNEAGGLQPQEGAAFCG